MLAAVRELLRDHEWSWWRRTALGAHFGAQTRITYRHPRWPTLLRICCRTFCCVTLGHVGLWYLFTENPRVGGSIPPLATTFFSVFSGLGDASSSPLNPSFQKNSLLPKKLL